ncbi:MAG: DUF4340 domain-containing protein [Anaerolineaceae bacterium]|nr:DUF4340 domain-containing protein [Anaerolineaceae bacterium]
MNRTQQILTGILILQILVAAFVFWPDAGGVVEDVPIFENINVEDVVSFSVDDADGNHVEMVKTGDGWVLPDNGNFPVTAEKIDTVLEHLFEIRTNRLITRTKDSHSRLQVADDDFVRRVWLEDTAGNQYILFIGGSSAAAATHVRRAGDDNVYLSSAVSSWEFGNQIKNWIDVVYLSIPSEEIIAINIENAHGKLEFEKGPDGEWLMRGLTEGEEFNPNNLMSMVSRLANIQMDVPLGTDEKPEYGFDTPSAVITVYTQNEEGDQDTIILRVGGQSVDGKSYFLSASNSEYYVKVASYTVQDFIDRDKEVFLVAEEQAE